MNELIKKFKKDKISIVSLFVLIFLYLMILFATFISPYEKNYSDRSLSYSPPNNIYTITLEGKFSKPYTYNWIRNFNTHTLNLEFSDDRSQNYYIHFFSIRFE